MHSINIERLFSGAGFAAAQQARYARYVPELLIPVCRKWMLYSTSCSLNAIKVGDTGGLWKSYAINISTRKFRQLPRHASPLVKLSRLNLNEDTLIGIDNIALRLSCGSELVRNGGLEHGMAHWFFFRRQSPAVALQEFTAAS